MAKLNILKTEIKIGIEKPFKILHMTDSHITRDDPFDGGRRRTFDVHYEGCAEDYYFEALAYARKKSMPILHTGDLIDFFSKGNFDFIRDHFSDVDYMYAAGNHDFCHMLGEAKEDYAYKWEKILEIAPYFRCNLYFDARVINGVNIVTLDNSYYFITKGQTELLRAEAAKGYPILLAMHVPLYAEQQARIAREEGVECAYLCGAPEELLATYSEYRRTQQTPDHATREAIDYIKNEPLVRAVIAGHTHRNLDEMLTERIPQYTTGGSYEGFVREITVK